jgi:MFS family permease
MTKLETRSLIGLASLYASRMLGLFMVLPVLSLYAADYSGSTTILLGTALGVYGLTQGLMQIPLGMLSDRMGRKTIIVAGMLLFLLGSIMAANAHSIYTLILGRALQGAGAVASTIMALLSDLTTEENRTRAMAAVGGSIGVSFALAMVIGPVVASYGGLSMIFWLTALLAVVGIAIIWFYVPEPAHQSNIAASEALTMPGLLKETATNPNLCRLDFGVFVLHMAQMASWVSVPFLLEHQLDLPLSRHWWLYLSTMGLGFVAMLPLIIIGERKRRLKEVFLISIALLAVGELVLLQAGNRLMMFGIGLFLFFMAFNLLEASLPSLVSKITPSGSRGTAMGIYSSSQFFGTFVGGVAGGYIAHNWGYPYVFAFCALVALIWLAVAATMDQPRHWGTKIIDLSLHPSMPIDVLAVRNLLKGVEEVTCIPQHKLLYLKIDRESFDDRLFDELMRNTRAMTADNDSGLARG